MVVRPRLRTHASSVGVDNNVAVSTLASWTTPGPSGTDRRDRDHHRRHERHREGDGHRTGRGGSADRPRGPEHGEGARGRVDPPGNAGNAPGPRARPRATGDRRGVRAGIDEPIAILVNNAGVESKDLQRTADGHELQFGTNHLGALPADDSAPAAHHRPVVTVASQASAWPDSTSRTSTGTDARTTAAAPTPTRRPPTCSSPLNSTGGCWRRGPACAPSLRTPAGQDGHLRATGRSAPQPLGPTRPGPRTGAGGRGATLPHGRDGRPARGHLRRAAAHDAHAGRRRGDRAVQARAGPGHRGSSLVDLGGYDRSGRPPVSSVRVGTPRSVPGRAGGIDRSWPSPRRCASGRWSASWGCSSTTARSPRTRSGRSRSSFRSRWRSTR